MNIVGKALNAAGIQFMPIAGTTSNRSLNLKKFQNAPVKKKTKEKATPSKERVLLISVMDKSASGANLTIANHAIFVSPLLTETQEDFVVKETQATGRNRRDGQKREVTIWRFLTADTLDTQIFEYRGCAGGVD